MLPGAILAGMSHCANVSRITLIISRLVWHTADIQMAAVEMSRNMKWKYVSGRSGTVCVYDQGRGIWTLPNSSWQNRASLGHFLQTAIRPNQSSCSVLECSNCTNQVRLAARVCATHGIHGHTQAGCCGLCRQSEIITLILLRPLERCQIHLIILHRFKWTQAATQGALELLRIH